MKKLWHIIWLIRRWNQILYYLYLKHLKCQVRLCLDICSKMIKIIFICRCKYHGIHMFLVWQATTILVLNTMYFL
jgi:hypothetical protein